MSIPVTATSRARPLNDVPLTRSIPMHAYVFASSAIESKIVSSTTTIEARNVRSG
ncbi:tandem-95 repeat protein [Sesbania bispinosa]|nr:tandem-95 repeat protein [Sesbania bispinosa]